MQQWEYRRINLEDSQVDKSLEELGLLGWELIHIGHEFGFINNSIQSKQTSRFVRTYTFKRPKE